MTEIVRNLRFQRKPSPVLAEHRPLYKICQILLVLHLASRGGRTSLPRLHLFNWALKSPDKWAKLVKASADKKLQVTAWGFDPALAIAIRFGIAEGLFQETTSGYAMSDKGIILVKAVEKMPDTFAAEKSALLLIGKGITETMVDEVAKGWEA